MDAEGLINKIIAYLKANFANEARFCDVDWNNPLISVKLENCKLTLQYLRFEYDYYGYKALIVSNNGIKLQHDFNTTPLIIYKDFSFFN